MNKREKAIQAAWDYVFGKLYYSENHMIYDYLTDDNVREGLAHFPTPEEIKVSSPNPCGWGTGMEDSTLNLATMLEGILNKYDCMKDPELKQYADMMMEGLLTNGTAAEEPGFIARCVCPSDGKSIYIDSSRDQYTNWVYAAHIVLHSDLPDKEQKERFRKVLVDVARKAERDVTPENDGYMLRLDGKPGVVSQMYSDKLRPHEYMRLPMLYMAAYEASGDVHWLEKYHEVREELLHYTEEAMTDAYFSFTTKEVGYAYGLYQHQYSVKLLYDCETQDSYKKRYYMLLTKCAKACEEFITLAMDEIDNVSVAEPKVRPWRERPASYDYGFWAGSAYYCPIGKDPKFKLISRVLRNVGEAVIIQCLCPNYEISQQEKEMYYRFVESVKIDQATSYWPIMFFASWWMLKKTGQV